MYAAVKPDASACLLDIRIFGAHITNTAVSMPFMKASSSINCVKTIGSV